MPRSWAPRSSRSLASRPGGRADPAPARTWCWPPRREILRQAPPRGAQPPRPQQRLTARAGRGGRCAGPRRQPGNSENAAGHHDGRVLRRRPRPSARRGPVGRAEKGAWLAQKADASTAADQEDVDISAVAVRVDEPGNGKKVGQENRALAEAAASTASTVDGPGAVRARKAADAAASAMQTDVATLRSSSGSAARAMTKASAGERRRRARRPRRRSPTSRRLRRPMPRRSSRRTAWRTRALSVRVFSPGDDGPAASSTPPRRWPPCRAVRGARSLGRTPRRTRRCRSGSRAPVPSKRPSRRTGRRRRPSPSRALLQHSRRPTSSSGSPEPAWRRNRAVDPDRHRRVLGRSLLCDRALGSTRRCVGRRGGGVELAHRPIVARREDSYGQRSCSPRRPV